MSKTKKKIPPYSYPDKDYHPSNRAGRICQACGLPQGKEYPKTHPKQKQMVECFACGALWFETKGEESIY